MRPGAETLLALLILFFFLKDSLLMLRRDEAVLVRHLGGGWHAGFGARTWRLGGREPYLVNPFMPQQPVFRMRWDMLAAGEPAEPGATAALEPLPAELTALWVFAWAVWVQLFVFVPTLVLLQLTGPVLLAAAAMVYLTIIAALLAVWLSRRALGLDSRVFALLAFECLACAPYAANIVRRVAALRAGRADFVAVARRVLDARHMDAVKLQCLARIDEQMEAESEDSADMALLAAARARFAVEGPDGQG